MTNVSQVSQRLAGVILAGGASQRMGVDKRSIHYRGQPLICHVINTVLEIANPVLVVGAIDEACPPPIQLQPGIEWITDELPHRGPLEGIRVALIQLQNFVPSADKAFIIGCDYPLFKPLIALRMLDQLADRDAVCLSDSRIRHPIPGIYRIRILKQVTELIAEDRRSLQALLDSIDCLTLDKKSMQDIDPDLVSLRNINCPADLAAIEATK